MTNRQPPSPRRRAHGAATAASPAPVGRCYGYARVSTTMQADEGESLDVQQRQLAGYAQMNGLTIDKVFVERGVVGIQAARRPAAGLGAASGACRPATW